MNKRNILKKIFHLIFFELLSLLDLKKKLSCTDRDTEMNSHLFNAMKWIIRSQQVFRLVSLRYENNQRKFVTDLKQVVISVAVIGLILALNAYFGYDYYMNVLKTGMKNCLRTISI